MPIDASAIGTALPAVSMLIDADRLRFFGKAIGETNPVYSDVAVARAGGHSDLPVPPTFLFGIELNAPEPFAWMIELGIDLRHVLHGEQAFTYSSVAHAGDTLIARPRIADLYTKKGGALEFVVKETSVTRGDGSAVAELVSTLVVRHPEVAS